MVFITASSLPMSTRTVAETDRSEIQSCPVKQSKADSGAARIDGRERGEDFPRLGEPGRERAQLVIEIGEVETRFDTQDLFPRANVFDQPVLFVFRERFPRLLVEVDFSQRVARFLLRAGLDDLMDT